jgi:hypothetical protein
MVTTSRLLVLSLILLQAACASIAGIQGVPDEQDPGATDGTPLEDGGPSSMGTPSAEAGSGWPTGPGSTSDASSTADVHGPDSPAPPDGDAGVHPPADAPSETTVGPVPCANSGAILCEGFENGLDPNTWPTTFANGGTVAVDSTNPHRGKNSLHVTSFPVTTTPPGVYQAMAVHPVSLPQTFYARTYVYFSAVPPVAANAFMNAQQAEPAYLGIEVETQNGNWAITDYAASPNYSDDQGGAASGGQWHCVEWLLTQTGGGATDVWLDGQELTGLNVTGLFVPTLDEIMFGISFYQPPPQPQYDLWIDDIYVDTVPVGCAR